MIEIKALEDSTYLEKPRRIMKYVLVIESNLVI